MPGVEKRHLCFVHTQLPEAPTRVENQFEYEMKSCPEEVKSNDYICGQKEVVGMDEILGLCLSFHISVADSPP